ncbi:MAG: FG-GAP repeat protein, partial [candidate division Zixibacteria bacterium]|nr:FG-GAP repeat protein [candidate division Zixibacteria bacterium]
MLGKLTTIGLLLAFTFADQSSAEPQLLGALYPDSADTDFGQRIIPLGDQNGDGYDDFLVSERFRSHIYLGGPAVDSLPVLTIDSTNRSCNPLGDVNGDSVHDFALPGRRDTGFKLGLYYGGSELDADRDLWFGHDTAFAVGYTVHGKDINQNGQDDIISWDGVGQRSVLLFELGADADSTPDIRLSCVDDSGGALLFGHALVGGDLNGDGYQDLAIGYSPGLSSSVKGAVYLYWGGPEFDTVPDVVLRRPGEFASGMPSFGYLVENVGDISGDGYDDIFASAQTSGDDSLGFVFFGGPNIDSIPDVIIDRGHNCARTAGDVNNDGFDDLLLGYETPWSGLGYVSIYLGGPDLDSLPDWTLNVGSMEPYHDHFCRDGSGIGDYNGDGIDDFAFA